MKAHTQAEVTVSLSPTDIERLLEDGELSHGDVTLTLYD